MDISINEATEYFKRDDLIGAAGCLSSSLRTRPHDIFARMFLVEVLCILGDFERADQHLKTVASIDAGASRKVRALRNLIRAAQARNDVFERGAVPSFVQAPSSAVETALRRVVALRDAGNEPLDRALAASESGTQASWHGVFDDGKRVEARDLDDRFADIVEWLGENGNYYWSDVRDVRSIQFAPAKRPIDFLWRQAVVQLENEVSGAVYFPVIYPGSSDDAELALGRKTDWIERHGLTLGRGRRMWLVGDDAVDFLALTTVAPEADGLTNSGTDL